MKTMKRVFSLMMVLAMALSLCVTTHAAQSLELDLGDSDILVCSLDGDDYSWSCNSRCVSVDDYGEGVALVSAEAVGTATITVSVKKITPGEPFYDDEGNEAGTTEPGVENVGTETFSVTVVDNTPPEPEPVDVSISLPARVGLDVGDNDNLVVDFISGSASDVLRWEWSSNDSSVITVNGTGDSAAIKAVGPGQATVSVSAYGIGSQLYDSARCTVTVESASSPITVSGGARLSLDVSETRTISATVSGGSGNYEFVWDASGSVGIPDRQRQNATIYGMDAGSGTVTLTVYDPSDPSNYDDTSWDITVSGRSEPLSATVSPASLALNAGGTGTLTVSASGGSGNNRNYTYSWSASSNKVSVSGNGASATVTAHGTGSATVSVDVYDAETKQTKTVEVPVSIAGGSATYNASGSVTVGADYPLSSIAGNIASEFQRRFGVSVGAAASVQLSSPSGSIGVIRAANGKQLRANESITYNSMQALYFQSTAAGTFTTGYTLTDSGNTLSGVVTITASGGAAVTGATLSTTSLDMDTYSSRYLNVNVTPSNAAYNVSWRSSNTNVVYISGSGTSVTLNTQGNTGRATVTVTVTGTNGGSFSRTCDVYVSSSKVFNPTLTVTLGSDYYGTSATDSVAKQFRNIYGYSLDYNRTTMRFSSTGNSRYGVMRTANGSAIRANTSYTFNECVDMYFEPVSSGTFSLPYTLDCRGDTLSGTLDVYIRSANISATLSQTNLSLATYSNQSLAVNVSPANVYYSVSWRSSNTNIATVNGNGLSATVKSGGTAGSATITATVTDRNGVEIQRSCSVTVSNKDAGSYNPSVSTTIGVPYRGTGTSDAMKSQFYNLYGTSLPNSASIRFSSTGNNSVAVMRLKNGTAIKSNTNYTMSEYIDMYTDTVSTGIFSVPYTVTYNGKALSGNVIVNVNGGMVNASISITGTQPYTFSSAASGGTTASSLLASAVTNALGGDWDHLKFGSTVGSVGTLYKDSNRTSLGSSTIRKSDLDKLCFVPSGTAGDYSVSFTVHNSAGNSLANGTLYIRVATSTTPGNVNFSDVNANDWYGLPVQWAVGRGITNGMGRDASGRDTFQPNTTCNRAQILTFLWRAQGSPMPSISNPFSDVKSSDYFYNVALWAFEKGLVSGTTFGEKTPCTRAAAVTYMWKLAGSPGADASSFSDVARGTETASAVDWALSKNITGGIGNDASGRPQFGPENTCTRGHIVTFLYRAYA